jgi:hypothetical protein
MTHEAVMSGLRRKQGKKEQIFNEGVEKYLAKLRQDARG